MEQRLQSIADGLRAVFRALLGLRLPLVVLLVLVFAYSIPQVRELGGYDPFNESIFRFGLSWVAAVLYLLAFTAAFLYPGSHRVIDPFTTDNGFVRALQWLLLGVAAGAPLTFNAILWSQQKFLEQWPLVILGALIVSIVLLGLATRIRERLSTAIIRPERRETTMLFVGFLAFALVTVALLYQGVDLARVVGPLALIYVFCAIVLLILSPIEFWASKLSIPFYSLMLVALFSTGYLSYGRDHVVRLLDGTDLTKQPNGKETLKEAFEMWLRCRPDLEAYASRKKPYPIFIVSAEGGGTYAAIHASTVLSRLQAENPQFAEHVFMSSGVSGGSIGISAFSTAMALVRPQGRPATCDDPRPQPAPAKPLTQAEALEIARTVVRGDYLSPTVGAGLFPNTLQLFSPVVQPQFDRARWLEYGMEETWRDALPGADDDASSRPFESDFFNFWRPSSAFPGLVINTVEADEGAPMVLAPFSELPNTFSTDQTAGVAQVAAGAVRPYLEYSEPVGRSIRISTAVGMSARFPYFFGPATIDPDPAARDQPSLFLFVDGGYYDSTGLNTAALIYENLTGEVTPIARTAATSAPEPPQFEVYLISIGYYSPALESASGSLLRRIAFPLNSLNNTRSYRASILQNLLDQSKIPHVDFELAPDSYAFPLGLFVNSSTADRIEKRVGEGAKCDRSKREELFTELQKLLAQAQGAKAKEQLVIAHNSCSLQVIGDVLK